MKPRKVALIVASLVLILVFTTGAVSAAEYIKVKGSCNDLIGYFYACGRTFYVKPVGFEYKMPVGSECMYIDVDNSHGLRVDYTKGHYIYELVVTAYDNNGVKTYEYKNSRIGSYSWYVTIPTPEGKWPAKVSIYTSCRYKGTQYVGIPALTQMDENTWNSVKSRLSNPAATHAPSDGVVATLSANKFVSIGGEKDFGVTVYIPKGGSTTPTFTLSLSGNVYFTEVTVKKKVCSFDWLWWTYECEWKTVKQETTNSKNFAYSFSEKLYEKCTRYGPWNECKIEGGTEYLVEYKYRKCYNYWWYSYCERTTQSGSFKISIGGKIIDAPTNSISVSQESLNTYTVSASSSASIPLDYMVIKVNGQTLKDCKPLGSISVKCTVDFTPKSDGTYKFTVVSKDILGLSGSAEKTLTIKVPKPYVYEVKTSYSVVGAPGKNCYYLGKKDGSNVYHCEYSETPVAYVLEEVGTKPKEVTSYRFAEVKKIPTPTLRVVKGSPQCLKSGWLWCEKWACPTSPIPAESGYSLRRTSVQLSGFEDVIEGTSYNWWVGGDCRYYDAGGKFTLTINVAPYEHRYYGSYKYTLYHLIVEVYNEKGDKIYSHDYGYLYRYYSKKITLSFSEYPKKVVVKMYSRYEGWSTKTFEFPSLSYATPYKEVSYPSSVKTFWIPPTESKIWIGDDKCGYNNIYLRPGTISLNREVKWCPYMGYTLYDNLYGEGVATYRCCYASTDKPPLYIPVVGYPLDEDIPTISKKYWFEEERDWGWWGCREVGKGEGKITVYSIKDSATLLLPTSSGDLRSSFITKIENKLVKSKTPVYIRVLAKPSKNIPLMQDRFPVAVNAEPWEFYNLNPEGSFFGWDYVPTCMPPIKVNGVLYDVSSCILESPKKRKGYWYDRGIIFDAIGVTPNKPGETGSKEFKLEFLTYEGEVFGSSTIKITATNSYEFVENSKFTIEFSIETSVPITEAYLEGPNGEKILGTIVDPLGKVAFEWSSKRTDETWNLTVCNAAGKCDSKQVKILGDTEAGISVRYKCSGGPPPEPGDLYLSLLNPQNGVTLPPGTVEIGAMAYVQGGIGSVEEVRFYVSKYDTSLGYVTVCSGTRTAPSTGNVYTYSCDLEEGDYKVSVYAEDSFGKTKSVSATFKVSSGGGSGGGGGGGVSVTAFVDVPSDACIVKGGSFPIYLTASTSVGNLKLVEVYVNNVLVVSKTLSQPVVNKLEIDVPVNSEGVLNIRVRVYDENNLFTEITKTVVTDPKPSVSIKNVEGTYNSVTNEVILTTTLGFTDDKGVSRASITYRSPSYLTVTKSQIISPPKTDGTAELGAGIAAEPGTYRITASVEDTCGQRTETYIDVDISSIVPEINIPPAKQPIKVYIVAGGHPGISVSYLLIKSLNDGKYYTFEQVTTGVGKTYVNPPTEYTMGGSPTLYGYIDGFTLYYYYTGEPRENLPIDLVDAIRELNPEPFQQ